MRNNFRLLFHHHFLSQLFNSNTYHLDRILSPNPTCSVPAHTNCQYWWSFCLLQILCTYSIVTWDSDCSRNSYTLDRRWDALWSIVWSHHGLSYLVCVSLDLFRRAWTKDTHYHRRPPYLVCYILQYFDCAIMSITVHWVIGLAVFLLSSITLTINHYRFAGVLARLVGSLIKHLSLGLLLF